MKKQKEKKEQEAVQKMGADTEKKIREYMENEAYAEVLNEAAELAKTGSMKPAIMYDVAYSYFILGDYERAATWLDTTLQKEPGHVAARILLARLCILEDRVDAGLAIFDFVLKHFLRALSEEEQEEIEEIVEFYGRNDEEKIKRSYPHIAAFLHLTDTSEGAIPEAEQQAKPSVRDPEPPAPEKPQEKKSPLEILRALKEKVAASSVGEKAAAFMKPRSQDEKPRAAESHAAGSNLAAATQQTKEVLAQPIPIREKLRMLNTFAGGYYYQGDYAAAKELLMAALSLDEGDEGSLRNMALLLAETGDKERALQMASRMEREDFLLLRAIREL